MNIIFSTLMAIIVILLLIICAAWFDRIGLKPNDKFIEKTVDKVSSLINSKISLVAGQSEAGPWYLVVYTQDSNYPIWISNNNIRSVHPGPELCNIVVKQFNGEDMVIENVISYELCSASDMCEYDM